MNRWKTILQKDRTDTIAWVKKIIIRFIVSEMQQIQLHTTNHWNYDGIELRWLSANKTLFKNSDSLSKAKSEKNQFCKSEITIIVLLCFKAFTSKVISRPLLFSKWKRLTYENWLKIIANSENIWFIKLMLVPLAVFISSVIRQKGETQFGCFK